ncbi:MAG: sigma-70 family RNA polymerase sigma factor [Armatimonadetes bacterium]|nr:sigma-70 family RNA polymerase sigma factor [Armatimonadota bacterium]
MEPQVWPGRDVVTYLPLVEVVARTLSRGLPSTVELDELINDGVIGLIDALRRYDPTRGVCFSTYASHRIRGAILDGLRARDPVPRSIRRALKARCDSCRAQARGGIQFLDLDEALMVPEDESQGPEALALQADLLRHVRRGLQALPPRDREVLAMRMIRGMPLREVAARLGLSITRIVEIQTRALVRLRRFLAGEPMVRSRRRGALCATATRAVKWQERMTPIPNGPWVAVSGP